MRLVIPDVTTCLTTNSTTARESGVFFCCYPFCFFAYLGLLPLPCPRCAKSIVPNKRINFQCRCWVAGWGRDATKEEGGQFSFIQKKVDVPLYNTDRCEARLRQELSKQSQSGRRFQLTPGELCAGGEAGKDSCDGDGGAPLVCQSRSGNWHVVGLVAWGIGCANPDVPAVYVDVYHYLNFITTGRA